MIKKSLTGLIIMLFISIVSCNNSSEYKEYSIKDLIYSESMNNVTDSSFNISMVNKIKTYKDSLAIFTEFYDHSMYKYDLYKKKIEKIGRIGKGPGEYLNALGLFIKDDLIYYSDANERGIESFDFNGKNPKKENNMLLNSFAPELFVLDKNNNIYYFNEYAREGYFVFSSKGKKYGKALKIFTENKLNRYPFAGAYLNNNKLYFMYMIESKIYSIDLENGEEKSNKINVKGFFNWDDVQNDKITKEMDDNTRKLYSRVGKFIGFQFNGKTFFYVHVYNEKYGASDVICNVQGDILFKIKNIGDYGFIDISNDISYIYTINEKDFIIKSFKWNKMFANLLNNSK